MDFPNIDNDDFWEEEDEELSNKIFPVILSMVMIGTVSMYANIATKPDKLSVFNPEEVSNGAVEFAKSYSFDMVKGINRTTRALLQEKLGKVVDISDPAKFDELVNMLTPIFGDTRANVISRTEAVRLITEGENIVCKQLGIEEVVSEADDDACDFCLSLDGVEGTIDEGVEGNFLPYHPNCNCRWRRKF